MFDPIRIYDKPAVILTQLGNGMATTDSVRRAMFDPAALSPRERVSYTDELKKSSGGNPIVDTAIDVLGNPLTWLAFVAGGAMASKNFARTGRFFTGGIEHAGYGDWGKTRWPFLRFFRALSASQELSNTPIPALLEAIPGEMRRYQNDFSKPVTPGLQKVLRTLSDKHGVEVKSLDPSMAPNAQVEEDLHVIRGALHSRLAGWDKKTNYKYVTGVKPAKYEIMTSWEDSKGKTHKEWVNVGTKENFDKFQNAFAESRNNIEFEMTEAGPQFGGTQDGKPKFLTRAQHDADYTLENRQAGKIRAFQIVDPKTQVRGDSPLHSGIDVEYADMERGEMVGDVARLNRDIKEYGLQDLIDGVDKMRLQVKVKLYGNDQVYEKTGQFYRDPNKILKLARGARNDLENQGVIGRDGRFNYEQAATANSILSEEVAGAIIEYGNKNPGRGMKAADIEKLIVDTYTTLVDDPYYLPRNTTAVYKNTGTSRVEVEPSQFSRPGSFLEGFGRDITPSGRTKFRTREQIPIDPEHLQMIADRYGTTPELENAIKNSRQRIFDQQRMDVRGTYKVHSIAPDISLQKYIVTSARDVVMFSDNPLENLGVIAALKDFPSPRTNVRYPGPTGEKGGMPASWRPYGGGAKPAGGFSLNDLVNTQMSALEEQAGADGYVARTMRQHVLPSVFGYRTVEDGASKAMSSWTRGKALSLANSEFFKAVESNGGIAERFVRGMRRYGSTAPSDSTSFGSDIARVFYGSTIGLNLNTALTNLLQPLHNLHQLGFKNTAKAYAQSIEQMYAYGKARVALGKGASPQQIEEAMDRTMSRTLTGGVKVNMRDIADIGSAWDAVEKPGFGAQITQSSGGVFEAVMRPFQITEMANRLATGNAVLNAAEEGWKMGGRKSTLDPFRAQQEARSAVEAMQFGSSPLNRPLMFYTDYLRNPAIRQFLQFPVRSAVNIVTMPGLIGGTRNVFGKEVSNPYAIAGLDTMRMLGVSAIAYEVGKNMFGADLSRGLAVGFVPDVDVDKDKELMLPVPPFADAMYSGVRSFMAGGDKEILSDVVPMLIPGGISISRALGGLPKSETLQALGLQKRYAAWDQADQEGNVPVFDQTGRLMGMYSGTDIVLRSMGTDMGRFQNQGEVTQFLLKNRDQMRDKRREWIAAVLNNNMSAAQKVKANYERQFGMPLTVTQQQMKEAVRVREESISSRTLSSMDKDLQQQYRDVMQATVPQAMTGPQYPLEQGSMYVWSNLPKR
jgi:hypothetical protein